MTDEELDKIKAKYAGYGAVIGCVVTAFVMIMVFGILGLVL